MKLRLKTENEAEKAHKSVKKIVGQQRYSNNNLLTTVSKGSGLHLLLGRDEVFTTLAVGFLQKKNSTCIDQQII